MKKKKNKFNFTFNRLKKLKNETGKWVYYYDENCPGLLLAISPKGTKSFRFHSWDKLRKKTVTINLGTWPEININTVREIVTKKRQQITAGIDVKLENSKIKDESTLNDVFGIWLEDYAKEGNISNWKESENKYEAHIKPYFGNKNASAITSENIKKWRNILLKKKKQRGDETLSKGFIQRVFTLLSSIYSNAAPELQNPCSGVVGYASIKRDVFLKSDELKKFFRQLEAPQTPDYLRDFLLLALSTGARRSNVLSMKWSDVDLNLNLWIIPARDAKGKEAIPIPLIDQAVEILKNRREKAKSQNIKSVFVFHSTKSKPGHIVEPKRAWKSFLKNAGLSTNYRLHDIRRTLGSWQAIQGVSTNIIGKSLGHKSKQATEHYAHLTLDPVRAAMQSAYDKMEETKDSPSKIEPDI